MTLNEDALDRTLRWMSDNVSGALNAVYPPEHPRAGDHCTNSGTGLITCCYINALGKVLLKGGCNDAERFKTFVRQCMQDFLQARSTLSLPPIPTKGATAGEDWLYHVFRCGFVHGFYPPGAAWMRSSSSRYWMLRNGRPVLNIDRLVRGFTEGAVVFRQKALADPDLRANFLEYLTK
jgi:hypothetical protein